MTLNELVKLTMLWTTGPSPLLCIQKYNDFVISNDSVSRQWRPWLDCIDAQAGLGLHCWPKNTFSYGLTHIISKLTHCILNRLSHNIYFNFRYVRLWDLHIPAEKWLNYLQTVETLIRCRILRHLIWVCIVCQVPFYESPDYNELKENGQQKNTCTRNKKIYLTLAMLNKLRCHTHS